jgi:hypothetical protein
MSPVLSVIRIVIISKVIRTIVVVSYIDHGQTLAYRTKPGPSYQLHKVLRACHAVI